MRIMPMIQTQRHRPDGTHTAPPLMVMQHETAPIRAHGDQRDLRQPPLIRVRARIQLIAGSLMLTPWTK
jgi:hypothetical protein